VLILSAILVSLTFLYLLVSIILIIGVARLKKRTSTIDQTPYVSILIPARNEEKTIASCLESLLKQEYPTDKYEIIVINDRSTDKTPTIISRYQEEHNAIKSLIIEQNISGLSGKQNALNEGLKLCKGEIIMNIDADCIAMPMWICRTVSYFLPKIGLTIGFHTHYTDGSRSVFADLQSLDMFFLMESAAGSIGLNTPTGCAGSNLSYRRDMLGNEGYKKLGFTVTEDSVLVQSVSKSSDWKATVIYDKDAFVITPAETSLRGFFSQRIRWTVGGYASRSWILVPLYAIFFYHLCLIVSIPLVFFVKSLVMPVLLAFALKAIIDFIRCWRVSKA
jgi:cellulose synthase/poly-beta-1,6-N-acetylglucosamine synthase-like glycosyltransferase